jgi:hypothetical protein
MAVPRDVADLAVIGIALEIEDIGHFLGIGVQRQVPIGRENRFVEAADAVVGVDLHQLRLLGILRVRVLAFELLEVPDGGDVTLRVHVVERLLVQGLRRDDRFFLDLLRPEQRAACEHERHQAHSREPRQAACVPRDKPGCHELPRPITRRPEPCGL